MWDGKQKSCNMYLSKIKAIADYHDCANALDEVEMQGLISETEYKTLKGQANTNDDEKKRMKLYVDNNRMCTYITLGQQSDHGLGIVTKTKTRANPCGNAYRIIKMMETKYRPNDVSAEIELQNELNQTVFKNATDYYNSQVAIAGKYGAMLDDVEYIKIMAKKVESATYSKMILDHLKGTNYDFEELCTDISKVQRMAHASSTYKKEANGSSGKGKEKEVQLTSASGSFNGECSFCHKKGHKRKDCKDRKEKAKGMKCGHCGATGHLEDGCWKKNPDKAPQWYKDLQKNKGVSASNVEICLPCVEIAQEPEGQDFV